MERPARRRDLVPLRKPHLLRSGFSGVWKWYCYTQDGERSFVGSGPTPSDAWHVWRFFPKRVDYVTPNPELENS